MFRKSTVIFLLFVLAAIAISACAQTVETTATEAALPSIDNADQMVIEVSYITPPQQEGPYYPVEKLADRDNDLLVVSGSAERPIGEVLSLAGVVYDSTGHPLENAVVEIWQTDNNGAYMHPQDPKTDSRDLNFQFYGESVTGSDGVYSFRTLLPGLYGNRPRHIHVKVRLEDKLLLTTQFYFADEIILEGDEANLLVVIAPAEDDAGQPIWVGERDIILNIER